MATPQSPSTTPISISMAHPHPPGSARTHSAHTMQHITVSTWGRLEGRRWWGHGNPSTCSQAPARDIRGTGNSIWHKIWTHGEHANSTDRDTDGQQWMPTEIPLCHFIISPHSLDTTHTPVPTDLSPLQTPSAATLSLSPPPITKRAVHRAPPDSWRCEQPAHTHSFSGNLARVTGRAGSSPCAPFLTQEAAITHTHRVTIQTHNRWHLLTTPASPAGGHAGLHGSHVWGSSQGSAARTHMAPPGEVAIHSLFTATTASHRPGLGLPPRPGACSCASPVQRNNLVAHPDLKLPSPAACWDALPTGPTMGSVAAPAWLAVAAAIREASAPGPRRAWRALAR